MSIPNENVLNGGVKKETTPVSSGSYWSYAAHVRRLVPEKNTLKLLTPKFFSHSFGAEIPKVKFFSLRWSVLCIPLDECQYPPYS